MSNSRDRGQGPSSSGSLFLAAASPAPDLLELQNLVAEQAVRVTGSELGGAVFLLCEDREPSCAVYAATGSSEHVDRRELGLRWRAWAEQGARVDGRGLRIFAESRAVARARLSPSRERVGMIQVESSTTSYSEDQLERLAAFAEVAEILIGRELLRLHADREGLDVHLVGSSTALLAMERDLRRVAASNAPVLIAGERGSGKELAAYAVHYYSARREGPFVALNSAALSETLFADELFGHHRGAFTGASHPRQGALLAARGGTLFLDEIGDMTPRVQAALLRFLEAGELRQVGSDRPVRADVRIVAATNKDLSRLVEEGSFRADVLDRLDVFRLRVPPLSARKSDLELLVTHLMKRVCAETGRKGSLSDSLCARCGRASTVPCVGSGFVSALERVELEGNVRELGNLVTRLAVLHPQETLQAEHVERRSRMAADSPALPADPRLDSVIRSHIERVLEQQDYNKSATARVLGLPLSTLIHKMKRLGLES